MESSFLLEDLVAAIRRSALSPETIAKRAGVSSQTLYAWMTGRTPSPRIVTMEKVADALGLSIVLDGQRAAFRPRQQPPAIIKRPARMALWRFQ